LAFHEKLGRAIAVKREADSGAFELMSGEGATKGEVVYHMDKEGRRIFLELVGQATLAGAWAEGLSVEPAGVEVAEEEARVDFYTYDESLSSEQRSAVVARAAELLRSGSLSFSVASKSEVLGALKRAGRLFLFKKASASPQQLLTLVKCGSFVSFTELLIEGVAKFEDPELVLTNVSRVHWLGESTGILLERLHVSGYPSKADKELYSRYLDELKLRDHLKLASDMDLFFTDPAVGAGLVLWAPNGARMRKALEDFLYKLHVKRGYEPVVTPHLALSTLFEISGHLKHYKQNMFVFEHDGKLHVVKPMNCPFHIMIFKRKKWSYRELPVRYFELGTVYRYERSGTLHGLLRVRGMTQDDAHIFLREDQVEEEVSRVLDLVEEVYEALGISSYSFRLSVRDPSRKEEFMGADELWEGAESALKAALKSRGVEFSVGVGDAAFYGPKIDVIVRDALGREWQCGTIQLDFNLPERFGLTYVDENNKERRVVMIHRAVIGTVERLSGVLLEYYAGRLPLWLAPLQVAVLPVEGSDERQAAYAKGIERELVERNIRAACFDEGRLAYRVALARRLRVPLLAVVGEREASEGTVSVREISYSTDETGAFKAAEKSFVLRREELGDYVVERIRKETKGILP